MENNKQIKNSNKECEYSILQLLNDVLNSNLKIEAEFLHNKSIKEYQNKLKVLQMLLYLSNLDDPDIFKDEDRLRNIIESKVNCEELLFGYMFYISQKSHFDYSWSYMRKVLEEYKEFLFIVIRFLHNVVNDIKIIAKYRNELDGIYVVFNEIFKISYINEVPYVQTEVLWRNFHYILMIKHEYNIVIKYNNQVLVAGNRNEIFKQNMLVNSVFEGIKYFKNNEE